MSCYWDIIVMAYPYIKQIMLRAKIFMENSGNVEMKLDENNPLVFKEQDGNEKFKIANNLMKINSDSNSTSQFQIHEICQYQLEIFKMLYTVSIWNSFSYTSLSSPQLSRMDSQELGTRHRKYRNKSVVRVRYSFVGEGN